MLSGNATSIEEIMIYRGCRHVRPVVPISQALMLIPIRERRAHNVV